MKSISSEVSLNCCRRSQQVITMFDACIFLSVGQPQQTNNTRVASQWKTEEDKEMTNDTQEKSY